MFDASNTFFNLPLKDKNKTIKTQGFTGYAGVNQEKLVFYTSI